LVRTHSYQILRFSSAQNVWQQAKITNNCEGFRKWKDFKLKMKSLHRVALQRSDKKLLAVSNGAVDIFSFWLVTAEADLPTCFITPARATAPEKFVNRLVMDWKKKKDPKAVFPDGIEDVLAVIKNEISLLDPIYEIEYGHLVLEYAITQGYFDEELLYLWGRIHVIRRVIEGGIINTIIPPEFTVTGKDVQHEVYTGKSGEQLFQLANMSSYYTIRLRIESTGTWNLENDFYIEIEPTGSIVCTSISVRLPADTERLTESNDIEEQAHGFTLQTRGRIGFGYKAKEQRLFSTLNGEFADFLPRRPHRFLDCYRLVISLNLDGRGSLKICTSNFMFDPATVKSSKQSLAQYETFERVFKESITAKPVEASAQPESAKQSAQSITSSQEVLVLSKSSPSSVRVLRAKEVFAKFAFVLGNSNYDGTGFDQLVNPVNDANDMSEVLKDLGFVVTTCINLNHIQMITELKKFVNKCKASKIRCMVFFYFAGHGFETERKQYLVPVQVPKEEDLTSSTVCFQEILLWFQDIPNRFLISVIDACRTAPPVSRGLVESTDSAFHLHNPYAEAEALFVWACASNQRAHEGNRNGLYTSHLLERLRNPNPDDYIARIFTDLNTSLDIGQRPSMLADCRQYYLI
jgi:hypothetical protein